MPKNTRIQTIIIAILCLLGVSSAAYYVYGNKNLKRDSYSPEIYAGENTEDVSDSGTDWRRLFTSGTISTSSSKTSAQTKQSEESLTSTDIFGRTFLTGFAKLKEAGLTDDTDSIEKINQQIIEQSISAMPTPKEYKITDINITNVKDSASLSQYGINVSKILAKYLPEKNEAEIASEAMTSGSYVLLKQIDPIILGYKNAIKELLTMTVYSQLATYHLGLINGLSIQVYNAESLRISDKDPLRGIAAVSMEIAGLRTIYTAIGDIKNYLVLAGVPIESTPDLPIK